MARRTLAGNNGFGAIEALIALSIICVLGLASYWFWSQHKAKTTSHPNAQPTSNITFDHPSGWLVVKNDNPDERIIQSPDFKLKSSGSEAPSLESGAEIRITEVTHAIDPDGKQRHLNAENYLDVTLPDSKSQITDQQKKTINGHEVLQYTFANDTTTTLFFKSDTDFIEVSIWYPSSMSKMGLNPDYNLVLNSLKFN